MGRPPISNICPYEARMLELGIRNRGGGGSRRLADLYRIFCTHLQVKSLSSLVGEAMLKHSTVFPHRMEVYTR
jgi:hypothetical protein